MKNIKKITHPVDEKQFINVSSPEAAYILGLIWADGTIGEPYSVSLATTEPDSETFKDIFLKTGPWRDTTYKYPNQPTWKIRHTIATSNKDLVKFLVAHDYRSKDASPCKILSTIPEHLKRFWFRGLVDGDGCLYMKPEKNRYSAFITSCFEQDWKYMSDLCNKLQVRFSIIRKRYKSGDSSDFLLRTKDSVNKFLTYIYEGFETDKIGLKRKYDKFQILKDNLFKDDGRFKKGQKVKPSNKLPMSGYRGVTIEMKTKKFISKAKGKYLGFYNSALEAAIAYNKECISSGREDCWLNIIPENTEANKVVV